MHAQSKIQQPHSNYRAVIPSVSYSKVVSGQIREISHVNTQNSHFSTIFTNVIQITNDEGVDDEPLALAFRAALRKLSHPNDKACEIFQAYVALKNGQNISEALVAASKPKVKIAPIKLPPDIRSKIHHRNRVRRFWQRSWYPALKNELRTISNKIASNIRHLSRARWEKTIEELFPETGTLWRRTSLLKKPFHHIPPKDALGSIAVTPIKKAEVIADSLQKQFEPNTDVENPRLSAHIPRKVQRFLDFPTCMDLEKTSPSEIQEFIKNLKPNKSPGIDLITNP
ncbi:uncharacterized protein TNCV_2714461 [Trichonephila clavipes]|nr:uncharacterized protein TNCV_2714461 [Trichonephila clavipes]